MTTDVERLPAVAGPAGLARSRPALWLLLPCLVFLAVFFIYPLANMLLLSFSGEGGATFANYSEILSRTIYLRVIWITVEIAFSTTVISLALGYPIAYTIAHARPKLAGCMIALVLIPFFTSMLVRTYAWMVILRPHGMVTDSLAALGVDGLQLIYNRTGVIIGIVYVMLPYMVLTLYSVMRGIDAQLTNVARSLGASDWQAFREVYFPLSMPGVAGGCLLVFILSSGFYIVPKLMGGPRDQMLASIIAYQVDTALNWNFAAALAVVLLFITFVGFAAYARLLGLRQLLSSRF